MNLQDISACPTKINIGCGYDKKADYLNVDRDPACSPDILLVDGDDKAIPRGHFVEVYAKDVLEHIPRTETLDALLRWSEYLSLYGVVIISTSSIVHVAEALKQEPAFDRQYGWTQCLFGTQAHPGDFHYTGFTETTLRVHLMAAGFDISMMHVRDRWLLWAYATKTMDWTQLLNRKGLSDREFVRAAYRAALDRDPDPAGGSHAEQMLSSKSWTRYDALRTLFRSPERLLVTARKAGL